MPGELNLDPIDTTNPEIEQEISNPEVLKEALHAANGINTIIDKNELNGNNIKDNENGNDSHHENGDTGNIENEPETKIDNSNKVGATDLKKENDKVDEKADEKAEVPMKFLDIKISINGISGPIIVQLSNHDTVQDIRQVILEKPECCYRTCFSLYLDGTRLDDFMELHDITGLTEDSLIKVVDEPYSIRESRIHIRRLRDLLVTMLEPNAFIATDNLSLSYCTSITGVDVEEEAWKLTKEPSSPTSKPKAESILPPSYANLDVGSSPLLEPLIIPDNELQMPTCLQDLRYSAWNPPPGYRKLAGDLLYLEVTTLDNIDHVYHITSSSNGFFVNRSSKYTFDPRPSNETFRSQTLAGLLIILSPIFKKNFSCIQRTSVKKHPLELVASPQQVYPWISPRFEHTQDPFRAEDAVTCRIGYEEQIPGQLRDWNEELQSAKELPKKTQHQRILRDRALFKITCDFVAAATRGAMAVVDGNVMAINPGEEEKMRMYIWNNIFFSFACDSREHYQKYGGDEAAYSAASLDLKGVEMYNKLDLEGLHTLGTVVIDYRGYRIIAQSIIPGILQREQENSVVYGSVDGGKTISTNDKFLEKLKKAGLSLKIRPHKVINEKDEEIELCSSIECKGIIGADGRYYILDLFRTFPPDVNFLNVAKIKRSLIDGGDAPDDSKTNNEFQYTTPHSQQLVSIRPPVIEAFIGFKYVSFVKVIAINKLQDEKIQVTNNAVTDKSEDTTATSESTENNDVTNEVKVDTTEEDNKTEATETTESVDTTTTVAVTDTTAADKELDEKLKLEEESDIKAVEAASRAVGSLSLREFDIRFNPDAHVKEVKLSSSEDDVDKLDKALIEDIAIFLSNTVVPKMVDDFSALNSSPIDGIALTEVMHSRGINMRYLGKIATLCTQRNNLEHVEKIVIKEMVIRSAKRQFKNCIQSANQRSLGASVSHFLNCFLGSMALPQPHIPAEESNKKKKNKKKTQKLPHLPSNNNVAWMSLSPALLWMSIKNHIEKHFCYHLESSSMDDFIESMGLQKVSLLREICIKTGIQILLREYDFDSKKVPPFCDEDILNIFPVVKCVTPKATDATAIFEAAQARLQSGFFGEAHELMIEALNMFNQVYGPLHQDIVICYRAIARIHYLADDAVQAVSFQKKAVIVAERIFGIDHPETLVAYVHLALYCYHAGLVTSSLKLMYRSRYLALLAYGKDHPDMATFDTNIGLMLHNQREFTEACRYLQNSCNLQIKYHGSSSLHTATSQHLVARVLTALGDYKSALNCEKATFGIYQKHFGKDDVRTKESSETLKTILNQAVMLQKTLKDIAEKGKVNPSKLPRKLEDDKFEKRILTMVNKIEEIDESTTTIKAPTPKLNNKQEKEGKLS